MQVIVWHTYHYISCVCACVCYGSGKIRGLTRLVAADAIGEQQLKRTQLESK